MISLTESASQRVCTPEHSLIELFHQFLLTAKTVQREISNLAEKQALNDTQFFVIWVCEQSQRNQLSQTEIASSLSISPGQVSGLVEQLRDRGFLECSRCQHDRRKQLWQATQQGQFALKQIMDDLHPQDAGSNLQNQTESLLQIYEQLDLFRRKISQIPSFIKIYSPQTESSSSQDVKRK